MRPADTWKDYELLDATDGNRLERWGETLLIRPDPQAFFFFFLFYNLLAIMYIDTLLSGLRHLHTIKCIV